MGKLQRVLFWAQLDGGVVWFTDGEGQETGNGDQETQVQMPEQDWVEMGEPREITVTVEPGDLLN